MIKGISKQIIEVKCMNDEYFEKILLFVKAEKADSSIPVLKARAADCCGRLRTVYGEKRGRLRLPAAAVCACAALSGLVVGIAAAAAVML